MPDIPTLIPQKVTRILEKMEVVLSRMKGSHRLFYDEDLPRPGFLPTSHFTVAGMRPSR